MAKKYLVFFAFLLSLSAYSQVEETAVTAASTATEDSQPKKASASGNYTIGIGPIGNFNFTNRRPEMSPGVGAIIYFDYRWSPELSTTASVMMLVEHGKDRDAGQNNIIFMGIPTFDIKYYFIRNPSRWDPYASVGIGYYVLTNGSIRRGMASGLGAQLGGGVDYYISSRFSAGLAAQFRSIAMLGSGSTGNFPLSLNGNFGFHF